MDAAVKQGVQILRWQERLKARSLVADNDEANGDNQRFAKRRRSDLPGYIVSEQLDGSLRVVVKDCSSTGALLQLDNRPGGILVLADELPKTFVLVLMRARERTEVECKVVRTKGTEVGVHYIGQFTAVAASPLLGVRRR